jgi:hypothetical protein
MKQCPYFLQTLDYLVFLDTQGPVILPRGILMGGACHGVCTVWYGIWYMVYGIC